MSVAGPTIKTLLPKTTEFEVDVYRNEDGGADVNVTPCGVKKWELEYDGLTEAELATLRAHYNAAKHRVNNFSFYDREAAVTYTGVKYESIQIPRRKRRWANQLRVILARYG